MDSALPSTAELLSSFEPYRNARKALLTAMAIEGSNRDPLAEFSERLVLSILGGELAPSRVQHGYDLVDALGRRIEVKYLANPAGRWVNRHHIKVNSLWDIYAIVIFEDLQPVTMVAFTADLSSIGEHLTKRHPDQGSRLQFTQANYHQLLSDLTAAAGFGIELHALKV